MLADVKEEAEKVTDIPVESENLEDATGEVTKATLEETEAKNLADDPMNHAYDNNFSNIVMESQKLSIDPPATELYANIPMEMAKPLEYAIESEKYSDTTIETEKSSDVAIVVTKDTGIPTGCEKPLDVATKTENNPDVTIAADVSAETKENPETSVNYRENPELPETSVNYRENPELPGEADNLPELCRGMEKPLIYDRVGGVLL